jgi:hypothetical protein
MPIHSWIIEPNIPNRGAALWQNCVLEPLEHPDIPILKQAKAEYAKLQ